MDIEGQKMEDGLALVGRVARLLNTGLAAEETLAAVAETLRRGLQAGNVRLWLREPNATTLKAIGAPAPAGGPRTSRSFAVLPDAAAGMIRLPLLHEGERLGMLEVGPGPLAPAAEALLPIIADILAPFLASIELSEDLAFEVARPRPGDRGTAPVHHPGDRLPARRPVRGRPRLPDPDLEPEAGDRHAGPAARRGGRPPGVRGAHPAVRARSSRRSSTRSSRPAEMRQMDIEVAVGRRGPLLPDQQDPDAAGRRRDHPRDHHRRGRHRVPHGRTAADPAEREAGRRRASWRPASCTRSTTRSPPSGPASRRSSSGSTRVAAEVPPADRGVPQHHRQGSAALHRHRRRPARFQPAQGEGPSGNGGPDARSSRRPSSCSSTTSGSSARRCAASWPRGCRRSGPTPSS